MAWLYLLLAGLLEVLWATTLKMSEGFTVVRYTTITVIGMVLSFIFLSQATKNLPLSVAYPIWTGIGAVGSIIVGLLIFKDEMSLLTGVFVILLLIGIIGIKVTSH